MAAKGRKRKAGLRTKSGRLSRAAAAAWDRGTERTQAMQALYGTDGCDAIGRAFRAGLLGQGSEAKAMLDTARRISNTYWRAYEVGGFTSPIADKSSGSVIDLDHERIKRQEEWLSECLDIVFRMGAQVNRAFRQLVIDVNPDCGPSWLDRLCYVQRTQAAADISDEQALRAALDALEVLSG